MDRIFHSLARLFYLVVTSLKKDSTLIGVKLPVGYYRNVPFPNNAKSWSRPVTDRAAVVSAFYLFQLGSGPRHSFFA